MHRDIQRHPSLTRRTLAVWRDRSGPVRAIASLGALAGLASLTLGASAALAGTVLTAVILPAFLGSVAGLLALAPLTSLEASPSRSLDGAEWARTVAGSAFLLVSVYTQIVPRMLPGGGYSMLGSALIAVMGAVFWKLSRRASSSNGDPASSTTANQSGA